MSRIDGLIQHDLGTVNSLLARADNIHAIDGSDLRFLDHTEAMLRGYLAPEMFLADALAHLANKPMDSGDATAWRKIKGVQECLFSGLTAICACCGRMEGDHGNFTNLCPDARGTFASIPTYCQSDIAQNVADAYPNKCGKKNVAGTEFCEEHQAQ